MVQSFLEQSLLLWTSSRNKITFVWDLLKHMNSLPQLSILKVQLQVAWTAVWFVGKRRRPVIGYRLWCHRWCHLRCHDTPTLHMSDLSQWTNESSWLQTQGRPSAQRPGVWDREIDHIKIWILKDKAIKSIIHTCSCHNISYFKQYLRVWS